MLDVKEGDSSDSRAQLTLEHLITKYQQLLLPLFTPVLSVIFAPLILKRIHKVRFLHVQQYLIPQSVSEVALEWSGGTASDNRGAALFTPSSVSSHTEDVAEDQGHNSGTQRGNPEHLVAILGHLLAVSSRTVAMVTWYSELGCDGVGS